jgi:hypothetical protein
LCLIFYYYHLCFLIVFAYKWLSCLCLIVNWIQLNCYVFLRSWEETQIINLPEFLRNDYLYVYVTAYKFCALNVLDIKGVCVKCDPLSVLVALCSFKTPFVSLGFSVIWRKMFSSKYCSFNNYLNLVSMECFQFSDSFKSVFLIVQSLNDILGNIISYVNNEQNFDDYFFFKFTYCRYIPTIRCE